jgi:hypothetical protein
VRLGHAVPKLVWKNKIKKSEKILNEEKKSPWAHRNECN